MQGRFVALLAAVCAVVALDACGDVTGIRAQLENADLPDVQVYAMNGTAPNLPAALLIQVGAPVPITSEYNFDIAFDLDDTGAVVIHTVKAVAAQYIGAHSVGLDTTSQDFDKVTSIVGSKFVYDSSLTVAVGTTVLVDAIQPSCSQFSFLGQNIRAKLKVDSVKTADRLIYVHLFVDPNCGFKSLSPGTPKE